MSDSIIAKRQMANLWGRAIGELNQKIKDIEWGAELESVPAKAQFKILDTSNTEKIPNNSEIWLNIRWRLRIQRYYCGTKSNPITPQDISDGSNHITVFGENIGEAKWDLKFVDPIEPGRVWAWTKPVRLKPREVALKDDFGNSLLSITVAPDGVLDTEAWDIEFDETNPTIRINPAVSELRDLLKGFNHTSLLIMPEVVSQILDEVIRYHCETPLQFGTDGWHEKWLTWAYSRSENRLPSSVESSEDMTKCLDWKKEVVLRLKQMIDQAAKIRIDLDGGDE